MINNQLFIKIKNKYKRVNEQTYKIEIFTELKIEKEYRRKMKINMTTDANISIENLKQRHKF